MDKQSGFLTHYLVSGPRISHFDGHANRSQNGIQYEQYLRSLVADRNQELPVRAEDIALGKESKLGEPWQYLYPCSGLVNFSHFALTLGKVELLASTVLHADEDMDAAALLWTYAAVDVWLNGEKTASVQEPVYKPIGKTAITLRLRKGENILVVSMQNLAVRDSRSICGIQLLEGLDKLTAGVPDAEAAAPFLNLDRWLSDIGYRDGQLLLPPDPPCRVFLAYGDEAEGGQEITDITSPGSKEAGINEASTDAAGTNDAGYNKAGDNGAVIEESVPFQIHDGAPLVVVYGVIGERKLSRKIELLHNQRPVYREGADRETVKSELFNELAQIGAGEAFQPLRFGLFYVLVRWNLGLNAPCDEQHIARALGQIEQREDCSDFLLAGLLRLMAQHELPEALEQRAERAILSYRYWMTEEGSDAMCFWSENHALMFYICAYMAGKKYRDRRFDRSRRSGQEVEAVALGKIREWLEDVERWGFEEFLSADYMCVTMGALLNVADYMDEPESSQAMALIDSMLAAFARHTFRGSIIAPQARIYRSVILPFTQAAQSLMHLLEPKTPAGNSEWLVFLMNSRYHLPYSVSELMDAPLETAYRTGNAWVKLNKQNRYMLTSVQSPRWDEPQVFWDNISFDEGADVESNDYVKSFNERFHGTTRFEPGVYGYQQHMWYAALDNDTVIFSNHPGELADEGGMRPGYWYGNGIMPAIRQEGSVLGAIYEIADDHPVAFTHLFFPEDKLDGFERDGHWLFGHKDGGYVGIWCSEGLTPHDDLLFYCEYRAYNRLSAYYCKLGSREEHGGFNAFREACLSLAPQFNPRTLMLEASDGYSLTFIRHTNKTQYV